MILNVRTLAPALLTTSLVGVALFGALEKHPGLKDDALKEALRAERQHQRLDPIRARVALYLKVDNEDGWVYDRYTKIKIKAGKPPLPTEMWVEQTWPRLQTPHPDAKTDLHQLFPVAPKANITRATFPFCDVKFPVWSEGGSRLGIGSGRKVCFEPPDDHKGDAARAMFYISVMYNAPIETEQEKVLRDWSQRDRPDAREKRRNDRVEKAQKSRNPFIDDPSLVKRISNF